MSNPFDQITSEILKIADDNVRVAVGTVLRDVGNQLLDLSKKYATPKKKPGRKPKAEQPEAPAEAPKKRGRKPKAAPEAEVPAAPKKRGRKPKVQTDEKPARAARVLASKSVYELQQKENEQNG